MSEAEAACAARATTLCPASDDNAPQLSGVGGESSDGAEGGEEEEGEEEEGEEEEGEEEGEVEGEEEAVEE